MSTGNIYIYFLNMSKNIFQVSPALDSNRKRDFFILLFRIRISSAKGVSRTRCLDTKEFSKSLRDGSYRARSMPRYPFYGEDLIGPSHFFSLHFFAPRVNG